MPVPQGVSVTGFDDVFGADFCHPPLTTVSAPTDEAGRALVDVLLDDRSADPERTGLPVRLVVRESTGPASASGKVPLVGRGNRCSLLGPAPVAG